MPMARCLTAAGGGGSSPDGKVLHELHGLERPEQDPARPGSATTGWSGHSPTCAFEFRNIPMP